MHLIVYKDLSARIKETQNSLKLELSDFPTENKMSSCVRLAIARISFIKINVIVKFYSNTDPTQFSQICPDYIFVAC